MNENKQAVNNRSIDAARLTDLFLAGAANLEAGKEWINELNVFPVPDGDTGTNMTLTIKAAVSEVKNLDENSRSMRDVCKAISSGSLRGARGNSGVILSQLLRGFGKVVRDQNEITVPLMADSFGRAVETAYKAVMKPKEGTILTVARGISEKARELADQGVDDFDTFILTFYNNGSDIFSQVHIANISKKNGKFTIHNSGANCQAKSYNSISDLIFKKSNGKAKGIMLIGIKRKINI